MRIETKIWMEEAEWDLENAKIMLEKNRWSTCAYHAHQAVEKLLKALLYAIGKTPWGHVNSVLLAEYLETTNKTENDLVDCARDLDRHYIASKYPSGSIDLAPHKLYTRKAAVETFDCAKKIFEFAKKEFESITSGNNR